MPLLLRTALLATLLGCADSGRATLLTIEALEGGGHVLRCGGRDVVDPVTVVRLLDEGASIDPRVFEQLRVDGLLSMWDCDYFDHYETDLATAALWCDVVPRLDADRHAELLQRLCVVKHERLRDAAMARVFAAADEATRQRVLGAIERTAQQHAWGRLVVLTVRLQAGDRSALGELFEIESAQPERARVVMGALLHHEPVREALELDGFDSGALAMIDVRRAMRFAREWYVEKVLDQRSPWRADPGFVWSEPHAAAKKAAFEQLVVRTEWVDPYPYRALPRDVDAAIERPSQLTIAFGGEPDAIVFYRRVGANVEVRGVTARPISAARDAELRLVHRRAALDEARYDAFVAGVRAVFAARVFAWWNGPFHRMSGRRPSRAIRVLGLPEAAPRTELDEGGDDELVRMRLLPLTATADMEVALLRELSFEETPVDAPVRDAFLAFWRAHGEELTGMWSGRQRLLLSIVRDLADPAFVPELAYFVAPGFVDLPVGRYEMIALACDALAACTGQDMRFDAAGARRDVVEVARDYHARLR